MQRETAVQVIKAIFDGQVDLLFVSPEKLQSKSFQDLLSKPNFPQIHFICIDEIHCASEWSHNFRPAYLQLGSTIKDILNVDCILGLTGLLPSPSFNMFYFKFLNSSLHPFPDSSDVDKECRGVPGECLYV